MPSRLKQNWYLKSWRKTSGWGMEAKSEHLFVTMHEEDENLWYAYLASLTVRFLKSTDVPNVRASISSVLVAKTFPDFTNAAHWASASPGAWNTRCHQNSFKINCVIQPTTVQRICNYVQRYISKVITKILPKPNEKWYPRRLIFGILQSSSKRIPKSVVRLTFDWICQWYTTKYVLLNSKTYR